MSRDDSTEDLAKLAPGKLAHLLGAGLPRDEWRQDELGAVLRHQLAVRIDFPGSDWPGMGPPGQEVHSATFAEILGHPHPPVVLLKRIQEFAKCSRQIEGGALPWAAATVLYQAAIVAALVRCGQRITRLNDRELLEGLNWALSQRWLEPPIRSLLQTGLVRLSQDARGTE